MAGDWQSFFVAQVGASAALTGLVFVALSINLARIMDYANLVDRAGEAVLLPPVAGGVVLLAGSSDGAGLLALGAVLSILAGIADAWVLLVEILR